MCLNCHAEQGCGLDLEERLHHASANNCLACHMPQSDTDIRHIAFTHHRIGIHSAPTPDSAEHPPLADLMPLEEPSQMSDADRERNLGLAYFSLSQKQADRELAAAYRDRAQRLLEDVRARRGGHREVAAALVRLYRDSDPEAALRLAHEALTSGGLAMKSKINCLFLFGELGVRKGEPALAGPALQELTKIRLLSEDWLLLGLCREQVADLKGARTALERAVELAPLRPHIRVRLADVYQQLGLSEDARRQRETASRLASQVPSAH